MEQYLSSIVAEKDVEDALKLFEEENIKRLKPLIFDIPSSYDEDNEEYNFDPKSLSEVIHSLKVRIRSYFSVDNSNLMDSKPKNFKEQANLERKNLDQFYFLFLLIESELHLLMDDYGKTFLLRTQRYFCNTLNEIKENGNLSAKNIEEFENLFSTLNKYNEEILNMKEEYEKDRETYTFKITNLENEVYVLRERNGEIGNNNNTQIIDESLIREISHWAILLENNSDPDSFKEKIHQSLKYLPQSTNAPQKWETVSYLIDEILYDNLEETENFRIRNLQEKEIELIKRVSDIKEITKRSKPYQNDLKTVISQLNTLF